MNLRNINPYVESTFMDWRKTHNRAADAPRQYGPLPMLNLAELAGTSSFGMSGVNAHALLQGMLAGSKQNRAGGTGLQKETHWALSPMLYFYDEAVITCHRDVHQCSYLIDASKPELSYLNDLQAGVGSNSPP